MDDVSEIELINQYLKGDDKSLEILISQYLKPVYGFAYRYLGNAADAEDITQDVFLRVWRNIKKYNQKNNFKTWIFSITKNACIDFLRKRKDAPFANFENEEGDNVLAETLADPAPLADELFDRANLSGILAEALKKMSINYRMVLLLHYNDHLTFQEISDSLGESINTIKSRHRRALIALKELLNAPKTLL